MKHFKPFLAAAAITLSVTLPAHAETTLTVHYPMPGFFKDVMDTISKKFMEENPDIQIQFANPSATYEEGIQTIMRQAGTDEMPDITFIGLNRLRMADEHLLVLPELGGVFLKTTQFLLPLAAEAHDALLSIGVRVPHLATPACKGGGNRRPLRHRRRRV